MHPLQVKEEFPRIKQYIDNAEHLCQMTNEVPEDLRNCLTAIYQEADQAEEMLKDEENGNRIVQCVDWLEKLGDRAMQTCRQAGNTVDEEVQTAVQQMHDAISDLKHRLH